MTSSKPFKWRHFQSDLILLNVRWYLRYSLSYQDLEEMMIERGVKVDHTTIYRWVQAYSPELDKGCRPYLKPTDSLVEQNHRFIKRRVKPGLGFGSFNTARRTLKGFESMNMIHKGQIKGAAKGNVMGQISFINRIFGVAA